jgi:hypothetical protein
MSTPAAGADLGDDWRKKTRNVELAEQTLASYQISREWGRKYI